MWERNKKLKTEDSSEVFSVTSPTSSQVQPRLPSTRISRNSPQLLIESPCSVHLMCFNKQVYQKLVIRPRIRTMVTRYHRVGDIGNSVILNPRGPKRTYADLTSLVHCEHHQSKYHNHRDHNLFFSFLTGPQNDNAEWFSFQSKKPVQNLSRVLTFSRAGDSNLKIDSLLKRSRLHRE